MLQRWRKFEPSFSRPSRGRVYPQYPILLKPGPLGTGYPWDGASYYYISQFYQMRMYQRQTVLILPPSTDQNRSLLIKRRRNSNFFVKQLIEANTPNLSTINFTENLPTFKNNSSHKSTRVKVERGSVQKLEKSLPLRANGSTLKSTKSPTKKHPEQTKWHKEIKPVSNLKEDLYKGSEGQASWKKGDIAQKRYEFIEMLGKGSFGTVFKGYDHLKKQNVAIKVIRPQPQCQEMAQTQINLLVTIRQKDPKDQRSVVRIKDFFTHRNRMCLVFQLLSINLYQMLRAIQFRGMPVDVIRKISIQLLTTLSFLKSLKIIHGDIKPQNIVLKQFNKTGIKLIDFGTSTYANSKHYDYLMSRYYRAPEIILGTPYDEKIDMWSVGCVLAELYLGKPLFVGENQGEQVGWFVETIGLPPADMLKNSSRAAKYFSQEGDIHNFIMVEGNPVQLLSRSLKNRIDHAGFQLFLRKILMWSPKQRILAEEAMMDPWILEGFPKDLLPEHVKNAKRLKQAINNTQTRSFRTQKRKTSDLVN